MKYRTLFNIRIGRLRVYGDVDAYISFGVSVGKGFIRVEFLLWGVGAIW